MRILLFLLAGLSFLAGIGLLLGSGSGLGEVDGLVLFVCSAVFLVGSAIVEAIGHLKESLAQVKNS